MENLYRNLPQAPGVYLMKSGEGRVIYIGKAGNLRRRVSSYFSRAHDLRIERLVGEIMSIDYRKTDSALEALILESKLIKQLEPKFNVKEKDDKSFLYVEITKEKFPRVVLARGKDVNSHQSKVIGKYYGPFTSAGNIREALKILRRIFPWSVHEATRDKRQETRIKYARQCFDYEIGLCPGTCIGAISRKDYLKNISWLKLFFEGKKVQILHSLQKEMEAASKKLEFERAEKLRRQIFALRHIRDTAMISEEPPLNPKSYILNSFRIEGYDISNISGASAVGAMVVFSAKGGPASGGDGFQPDKNEYRKFKIRTLSKPDDTGMVKEVMKRRFKNDWLLPDLILIDGGKGQVNTAHAVLREAGLKIPVLGIAKGVKRKKNEFIGKIPKGVDAKTLIRVRDEAHRFAISYHKRLRRRNFIRPHLNNIS